ncbi:hypothetical protein [Methylobacterium radiotolerans]
MEPEDDPAFEELITNDLLPSHPDGKPWRKACAVCAFRRGNPQNLPEVVFEELYLERELGGFEFMCAHRSDAGHVRECACWAAMNAGRRGRDGVPV